jgi:hypothetical protein
MPTFFGGNILHLVPKEASLNASMHYHLLEEDIPATIMDTEEDKDVVNYGKFPFQISEHDDENFAEMKSIDVLEKP